MSNFCSHKRKAGPVLINDDKYCDIILLGGLPWLGSYKLGGKKLGNQWKTNLNGGNNQKQEGMDFLDFSGGTKRGEANFSKTLVEESDPGGCCGKRTVDIDILITS